MFGSASATKWQLQHLSSLSLLLELQRNVVVVSFIIYTYSPVLFLFLLFSLSFCTSLNSLIETKSFRLRHSLTDLMPDSALRASPILSYTLLNILWPSYFIWPHLPTDPFFCEHICIHYLIFDKREYTR